MHLQVCFLTRKKIWKDQSQYAERVKLKETEKMLVKGQRQRECGEERMREKKQERKKIHQDVHWLSSSCH